jgi:hypothetical protein
VLESWLAQANATITTVMTTFRLSAGRIANPLIGSRAAL